MSEHRPKSNFLVRLAVERRVTMAMAVLGVIVLGWLSLSRLPLEFMPAFQSSNVSVGVPYNSSSPDEIERMIVWPLEDSLSTINGIERLTARASADSANIDLEFVQGTDVELAAVEVRDRLDRVRSQLPDGVERIFVRRHKSSDFPIMRLSMSAPWESVRLFEFMEDVVQRRVERLEGVANVEIWGIRSRQLKINLSASRMASHGIDARDIVQLLRNNNVSLSAGNVREGSRKLLVRAVGELDSVEQLEKLPLNGAGLTLDDVADVAYEFPKQTSFTYLNGQESVSVNVYKASNANLLAVTDATKAELAAILTLPEAQGLGVQYTRDSSVDVRQGLAQLRNTGLLGGVLAIVFMLFFLRRVRMTLLVALAIPLSLILTFVIMYLGRVVGFEDISINIMSLMGLMLAVGMLVDNSIVVSEAVVRRRQTLGEDAKTAALRGASEVAMPIICATLTTICVFVPMVFLQQSGGRFSSFMKHIGLTVCIVMMASLVVSLTVVPMVSAIVLRGEKNKEHRLFDRMVGWYGSLLQLTLRHRLVFTLAVAAVLAWSIWLFQGIERTLSTPSYERQVALQIDVPRHYSIDQRHALYEELYALFDAKREELEIQDMSYRYRRAGGRSRWGGYNRFEIYLNGEEQARRSTAEIRDQISEMLPVKAGVDLKISRSMRGPPGADQSIQVELMGDNTDVLEHLSEQVMARLRQMPMVKDVDSSLESGDEEIHVAVNRERALQAGLSTSAIAMNINSALSTRPVSYFKGEEREIGLVVQYSEEERETLEQLKKMNVRTPAADLPVGSLASFEMVRGPRSIERENRMSKLTMTIETQGNVPSFGMMGPVSGIMASIGMPPGYSWGYGWSTRFAQQEVNDSTFTLLFAMVLIYMIMASLFENFLQPLTIMLAVPFAFIGVGIVMKLANQPRGNMTELGLVILLGVVVNNAIVLIDHVNHLREGGMGRDQAIIQGGKNRLRPIVMTAVTTILGLSPMVAPFFLPEVFGQLEGRAAFWSPIGLIILGGLTTSTFLTLMIIPTIYSLMDDLTRFGRKVARAL